MGDRYWVHLFEVNALNGVQRTRFANDGNFFPLNALPAA